MEWLLIVFLGFTTPVSTSQFESKQLCEAARIELTASVIEIHGPKKLVAVCVQKKFPKKEML